MFLLFTLVLCRAEQPVLHLGSAAEAVTSFLCLPGRSGGADVELLSGQHSDTVTSTPATGSTDSLTQGECPAWESPNTKGAGLTPEGAECRRDKGPVG